MRQREISIEGILLVNKPKGCTSHDVVARLRKKLMIRKIGHAGTLDPNATGLLIMLIGKATRLSQYLISNDKYYQGVITLGASTDTYDVEGDIQQRYEGSLPKQELIKSAFENFLGDQYQLSPMFSAKKVKGVALYKLARKGKTVEREPHFIRIHSLELLEMKDAQLTFYIHCSKGTYVRVFAHDLGKQLGCGGYLEELCRTGSGEFTLENALTLEKIESMSIQEIQRILVPIHKVLPNTLL